jgi:hypothetical protein
MFCKGCGSPEYTQGMGYVSPNEFVNSPHLPRNEHLLVTDSHFKYNQFINSFFQLIYYKQKNSFKKFKIVSILTAFKETKKMI